MDIAPRVKRIDPSLTLQINAEVAAMEQAGGNVIRLGAGEPDFDTPEPVRRAAIQAIDDGETHYTAAVGRHELRRAVCGKLHRDNGLGFEPDEVMVTCGAKQALYDICQTLLRPGDEAVIPSPYWVRIPQWSSWRRPSRCSSKPRWRTASAWIRRVWRARSPAARGWSS